MGGCSCGCGGIAIGARPFLFSNPLALAALEPPGWLPCPSNDMTLDPGVDALPVAEWGEGGRSSRRSVVVWLRRRSFEGRRRAMGDGSGMRQHHIGWAVCDHRVEFGQED